MGGRLFAIFVLVVMVSGCTTTTQSPQSINLLQVRVGELERELDMKNQEITDFKYELKDLSYEIDRLKTKMGGETTKTRSTSGRKTARTVSLSTKEGEVIRVNISVKQAQTALKNAGYYDGNVDGKLGTQSRKAIEAFQRDNNLKADGIIGAQTWKELKSYLE